MAASKRIDKTPRPVREPEKYVSIPGVADPVPLRFVGAKCPGCGRAISDGGAFLNHERKTIEFWRCAACGGYAFESYPEIRAEPPGHCGAGANAG